MKSQLLVLVLLFSSACCAQETPERSDERTKQFRELDKNGDNRLSKSELPNAAAFERMDSDSDGFVSAKEAETFAQRRRRRAEADASQPTLSDDPVFPPDPDGLAAKRQRLSAIANVSNAGKRPPNVVLILADDLGYGDVGLYGSTSIPTPHIDALGRAGTRFTHAYVTAASCSPSRAGLISGRYQQRFGFEFNTAGGAITHRLHRGLDPNVITLPDVLHQAGYVTGMFGKWHLGTQPHFHPQQRGFDQFYGFLAGAHSFFPAKAKEPFHSTMMRARTPLIEKEYLTDAIARETANFIDENHDKPFFAYVPFNAVHTPIEATKKYQDRFPGVKNVNKRDYFAMTSAFDDAVGTIVESIKKNGLTDNTLLIFLNDNGGPIYTGVQSNGPLKLGKLFLFEGGIRVPMILKWPGKIAADSDYKKPTISLDLFATICAATGIQLPDSVNLDGVNLIPYMSGENAGQPHDALFWSNGPNIAVRKDNWKLVKSYDNVWLFDLANDEGETTNLAASRPEKVKELEQAYQKWRTGMAKPAWPSKPRRRKMPVDGMTYELNI